MTNVQRVLLSVEEPCFRLDADGIGYRLIATAAPPGSGWTHGPAERVDIAIDEQTAIDGLLAAGLIRRDEGDKAHLTATGRALYSAAMCLVGSGGDMEWLTNIRAARTPQRKDT